MSIEHPGLRSAAEAQETLVGRSTECSRLDEFLQGARDGQSAVLAVRGEAGSGKTALLDYAAGRAEGFQVVRVWGAEREADLPYAGLHLVCARLGAGLERLSVSQRETLVSAIGGATHSRPEPFAVCVASLALFIEVASVQPLLCIVDDMQWLDQPTADVLSFIARRLGPHPVAVLMSRCDPHRVDDSDGVPELVLGGLCDRDACTLFRSALPGPADSAVIERIIAETRGNPRAVLDLCRDVSPADFAGGFGPGVPTPHVRDETVLAEVAQLPDDSRRQLLVAAADPTGDPMVHWRAMSALGIPFDAFGPIESRGLMSIGARVTFTAPWLRPAVYRSASAAERRDVHRALAAATDGVDPDWRSWHRAQAAEGLDDVLAAQLERCASRLRDRAGVAAAAAFLGWSAVLTSDPRRRTERLLVAAAANHEADAPEAAARLLVTAESGPLDRVQRGRLERLRAELVSTSTRGCSAVDGLLNAARRLDQVEPDLAIETYLEALTAAVLAGRFDCADRIAQAARTASDGTTPRSVAARLLAALVCRVLGGYPESTGRLAGALAAVVDAGPGNETAPWFWLAGQVAADLWDDETWHILTARRVAAARDTGALTALPNALAGRALVDAHFGNLDSAAELADQARRVSGDHDSLFRHAALFVAGWRGDDQAPALIENARRDAYDSRAGLLLSTVEFSAAVLYNGLGRYNKALEAACEAGGHQELAISGWALIELVEAATRCQNPKAAATALELLSERTRLSCTDWALGVAARSRALLAEGTTAEALYVEAIERLKRSRIAVHLGRAHLIYGEWLRRQERRVDARVQLRTAHEMLTAMGANAFADRAKRELLATGERARRRVDETRNQLTPQEARIARMAVDGMTNPEIGTRLFVSPRTVEYHLHKVFTKLGIRHRCELHLVLGTCRG